jgi:hypothetical protein
LLTIFARASPLCRHLFSNVPRFPGESKLDWGADVTRARFLGSSNIISNRIDAEEAAIAIRK